MRPTKVTWQQWRLYGRNEAGTEMGRWDAPVRADYCLSTSIWGLESYDRCQGMRRSYRQRQQRAIHSQYKHLLSPNRRLWGSALKVLPRLPQLLGEHLRMNCQLDSTELKKRRCRKCDDASVLRVCGRGLGVEFPGGNPSGLRLASRAGAGILSPILPKNGSDLCLAATLGAHEGFLAL